MAELTRYQQTGRIFADVPQLDFANVRESFKRSQTISNALDRVSEFAFKEGAKFAEKQAEQFAIDNPLTIDQVREASRSGVNPEDLVKATGGGAIWQETLTKLQGEQLRNQLEVLGKQALIDLQTQVETGQIVDMEEVRAKQEAVVNGLRKTLSFAPDSVLRFDATMGTISSALYKEAQGQIARDYKISEQSKSQVNFDNTMIAARAMVKEVNDPEMLREVKYALADQLERQSADGGLDFALNLKEKFLKEMDSMVINSFVETALSDDFYTNPLTGKRDSNYAYNKLVSGQIPGKERLWEGLDYKDKAIVFNNFRQRENELNATRKEAETLQHEEDLTAVNKLMLDYFNSGKRDRSALKKLEEISVRNPRAVSAKELEEIRKQSTEDSDKQMSKWAYSDSVIRLKEIARIDPSVSWDTIKQIGLKDGVPSSVINRYVYPSYANPNQRDYENELKQSVPTYGTDTGAKIAAEQERARKDSIVEKRLLDIERSNSKLPEDKRKPLPSKSDMLKQLDKEEEDSNKAKKLEAAIQEGNAVIDSRKVKGIQLTRSSSTSDAVLMNQINKKENGKYILDEETRNLIISYIKQIERNKL